MAFATTASFAQQKPVFIGTYTDTIHVYMFDENTGSLTPKSSVSGIKNPSFLAPNKRKDVVYAVSESADGSVASFTFKDGVLTKQSSTRTMGDDPCYVDVHGNMVVVGNYSSGNFSTMTINKSGALPQKVKSVKHIGNSLNTKRQEASHVHSTRFSPDGRSLWVADLGTDNLYVYPAQGGEPTKTSVEPASGPRHFEFHPKLKITYLLNEMSGDINVYKYDKRGLIKQQTIKSSLAHQDDIVGVGSADIHITPNGKFLYASHRGVSDLITIYRVESEGTLTATGQHSVMGKNPRNFAIDPTGRFLIVANGQSNNVVVMSIDPENGALTPTGTEINVTKPVCIRF